MYIGLYLFMIIYSGICKKFVDTKRRNLFITFGIFSIILLLLGLRHQSMGIDLGYDNTTGYLAQFSRIAQYSFHELFSGLNFLHYEPGYILLNKIIGLIRLDNQFFLFSIALLSLIPISITINKNSKNPLISWIVYLGIPPFLMLFSGLRQALAIGICFFSLDLIKRKKPFHFFLLILLAALFHRTALVFLVAYPIYNMRMTRNKRIFSLIALGMVFIFREQIFMIVNTLLNLSLIIDNNNAWLLLFVLIAIYIYCTVFPNKDKELNGYLNILYLACLTQSFGGVNMIVSRIGYYFMVILVLLIPKALSNISHKNTQLITKFIVYVCFIAFGIYSIYTTSWAQAFPYRFFSQ